MTKTMKLAQVLEAVDRAEEQFAEWPEWKQALSGLPKARTRYRRADNGLWLSQGDAFHWLSKLKDKTVDLIVSDIPYESLEKHRSKGTTTRLKKSKASSNEWFGTIPNESLWLLMEELYRVLKPKRHCYMMCDDETSDILKKAGQDAGFYCWKRIVWDRDRLGMGYHYRASYEFILFFEKGPKPWVPGKNWNGQRQLNDRSLPDILKVRSIRSKDAYPTEKPIPLLEILVNQSTQEGELVIDPFMGSGNCGKAALQNDRFFWGNDISNDSLKRTQALLAEYMHE
jgi:site-specific DNA-methyltransferase (adenine-specific)